MQKLAHNSRHSTLPIPTIVVKFLRRFKFYDIFCDVHDSRKRVVGLMTRIVSWRYKFENNTLTDTLIIFFKRYSKSTYSTILTIKTETNANQERMNPLLH